MHDYVKTGIVTGFVYRKSSSSKSLITWCVVSFTVLLESTDLGEHTCTYTEALTDFEFFQK